MRLKNEREWSRGFLSSCPPFPFTSHSAGRPLAQLRCMSKAQLTAHPHVALDFRSQHTWPMLQGNSQPKGKRACESQCLLCAGDCPGLSVNRCTLYTVHSSDSFATWLARKASVLKCVIGLVLNTLSNEQHYPSSSANQPGMNSAWHELGWMQAQTVCACTCAPSRYSGTPDNTWQTGQSWGALLIPDLCLDSVQHGAQWKCTLWPPSHSPLQVSVCWAGQQQREAPVSQLLRSRCNFKKI